MTSVTMWIVGDLAKVSGRQLLLNALKHVVSTVSTFFLQSYCAINQIILLLNNTLLLVLFLSGITG